MFANTNLIYPILLIKATAKRSFEELGRMINKSGDTIKKLLPQKKDSMLVAHKISRHLFQKKKVLTLSIDDTLLKKLYSKLMVGSGSFFDTKLGRRITAYRLIVAVLTDGAHTIPISFGFMFDKNLLTEEDYAKTKLDFIKEFYALAKELFPNVKIKVAADGLFASVEFLKWCLDNEIESDVRMHSNRKVEYMGIFHKIKEIKCLKPVGRQMARTITVQWHGLSLELTAERRIDKHGDESIVYIASTYKAQPMQHVLGYRLRWPIEKLFRTGKQHLGIEQCFSTSLETQEQHVAAVFAAYAIAQLEMKIQSLTTPEKALRAIKKKSLGFLNNRFGRLDQIFGGVYA